MKKGETGNRGRERESTRRRGAREAKWRHQRRRAHELGEPEGAAAGERHRWRRCIASVPLLQGEVCED